MNPNKGDLRQKSAGRMRNKSLSDRLGLQKEGAPPKTRQAPPPPPPERTPYRPRTAPAQLNPQKPGYQPGGMRQNRRVTQAEQIRLRNRRRAIGAGIVLAAMLFGVLLSVNLLFKITAFRVENLDRSTPADTGIYSEEEILTALGLQAGDKLFFSTAAKTRQLQSDLPYLDEVQVALQMPGTVVIKVHPATERFAVMYSGGWMVLSDSLKILRLELSQPTNLVLLTGSVPADTVPAVGQTLSLQSYNSLMAAQPELATAETARATADETLNSILTALQSEGLLDGVSAVDVADLSALNFTYEDRVTVLLGGAANLDYKLRMAGAVLLDPEKGLAATDHGTLDISQQQSDGEIRAYFQPNEPQPTPAPEGTEENSQEDSQENAA